MMAIRSQSNQRKNGNECQRCKGWMIFEKFYGLNAAFFGWHWVMCGNVTDPVFLLPRISQDADIAIPQTEEKIISRIKRFMSGRQRRYEDKMDTDKNK
jgi:hypothetical protein